MNAAPPGFTVSELASETRVPIARIKFYLREGLLPPGDLAAEKRAFYDARHVQRLRLIHALRQVAGLGVPAIRGLCKLLDADGEADLSIIVLHVLDALGVGEHKASALPAREVSLARAELSALLRTRGIRVRDNARAVSDLSRALVSLRQVLGPTVSAQAFVPYLEAMCALAEQDFATTAHLITDRVSAGVAATLGTALWEPVIILLRRIAHEHVATTRLAASSSKRRLR